MWIDATPLMTVFRILAGRGQAQAKDVIGRGYGSSPSAARLITSTFSLESR